MNIYKQNSTRKALRPTAIGLIVACLATAVVALAATGYNCNVLVDKCCVNPGDPCNADGLPGTIADASLMPRCSGGSPGMSACTNNATVKTNCTYDCEDQWGWLWQQSTLVPVEQLGGTNCPAR